MSIGESMLWKKPMETKSKFSLRWCYALLLGHAVDNKNDDKKAEVVEQGRCQTSVPTVKHSGGNRVLKLLCCLCALQLLKKQWIQNCIKMIYGRMSKQPFVM